MSPPVSRRQYIPQHVRGGKVQRDARFDNARGCLIILVVIGHFLLPLYETRFIAGLKYAIYVFHMPCFILISGYYAKSLMRGGHFRWGRVVETLWLYLIFDCIVNITEGMLAGHIPLIPDFLHESGAPWYLLSLSTYYLLVPLISKVPRGGARVLTILLTIIAVTFGKYLVHPGSFLALDRTISFLPFFCAGYFISQATVDSYMLWPGKNVVQALALTLTAVVFLLSYDVLMKYNLIVYGADYARYSAATQPYLWIYTLVWFAVSAIISVGFIGMMLTRPMAIAGDLGKNTLQIYILHRPIRDLAEYFGLYELINPHSKLNVILFCIALIPFTVFLGNRKFAALFRRIRSVFDPVLEKAGGL